MRPVSVEGRYLGILSPRPLRAGVLCNPLALLKAWQAQRMLDAHKEGKI